MTFPKAQSAIESALKKETKISKVSIDVIRWNETPDAPALHRLDVDGSPLLYLHQRKGRWRAVRWPPQLVLTVPPAILEKPTPSPPLGEAPPPESPKEAHGQAVAARASQEEEKPQPALLVGIIEDAIVFAASADIPDAVWQLIHSRQKGTPIPALKPDGLAGSCLLYKGGVAEWGSFPYQVPSDAGDRVFAADKEITTIVLRAIDAAADGPQEVVILNR